MTKTYSPELLREIDVAVDVACFDGGKFVGLMKRGMWYRPKAQGYTDRVEEAGRFTRDEAALHEYPAKGSKLESDIAAGKSVGCFDPVTIHEFPPRRFTTDPAESDALDDVILGKLSVTHLESYWLAGKVHFRAATREHGVVVVAYPDKKVARAIFALRLKAPNCEVLKKLK